MGIYVYAPEETYKIICGIRYDQNRLCFVSFASLTLEWSTKIIRNLYFIFRENTTYSRKQSLFAQHF